MEQLNQFKGNLHPLHNIKQAHRWMVIIIIVLLSLVGAGTVYAAVTFDSYTGPQWLDPGYQFTATTSAWTAPQDRVCILYSVDSGSENKELCTCTSPACDPATNLGQWVCTILKDYNNATISWDISAYHDSSCVADRSPGFMGSFTTGPTSVVLKTFTTESQKAISFSRNSIVAIGAGIICILLAVLWRYRKGKRSL
jgi:hypothetical protein